MEKQQEIRVLARHVASYHAASGQISDAPGKLSGSIGWCLICIWSLSWSSMERAGPHGLVHRKLASICLVLFIK